MRMIRNLTVAALAWFGLAAAAQADLIYQISVGGNVVSSTTIAIGETVELDVYLAETDGGTILADELLFSAGVRIFFDNPSGIAEVLSDSDIIPSVAFSDSSVDLTATSAGLTESVGFDDFIVPDGDNRIFLGTFRLTGLAAGIVSVTAADYDPDFDDTLTGSDPPRVLDALIGGATIRVIVQGDGVVPEPSSLALSLIGGGVLLAGWRLRRR